MPRDIANLLSNRTLYSYKRQLLLYHQPDKNSDVTSLTRTQIVRGLSVSLFHFFTFFVEKWNFGPSQDYRFFGFYTVFTFLEFLFPVPDSADGFKMFRFVTVNTVRSYCVKLISIQIIKYTRCQLMKWSQLSWSQQISGIFWRRNLNHLAICRRRWTFFH